MSSIYKTTRETQLPTFTGTVSLLDDEIDDRPWAGRVPTSRPWGTGFMGHPKWSLPGAYKTLFSALSIRCILSLEDDDEALAYCVQSTLDYSHDAWKSAWCEPRAMIDRMAQVQPAPGRVFGMKTVMLRGAQTSRPRYTGAGVLLGYVGVICGKGTLSPVARGPGSEEIVFASPTECASAALVQAGGPLLPVRMTQFKLHYQGWIETTLGPEEARLELGLASSEGGTRPSEGGTS